MKERLTVTLKNFSTHEADCQCGCGKITSPELMLRLQAFLYILERIYVCPLRCLITGGARCNAHQKDIYGGKKVESYHCGIHRGRQVDPEGLAVDVVVEINPIGDGWARVSKHTLAKLAVESKLFGGVGWQVYGPATQFVHLDLGPVRTF